MKKLFIITPSPKIFVILIASCDDEAFRLIHEYLRENGSEDMEIEISYVLEMISSSYKWVLSGSYDSGVVDILHL